MVGLPLKHWCCSKKKRWVDRQKEKEGEREDWERIRVVGALSERALYQFLELGVQRLQHLDTREPLADDGPPTRHHFQGLCEMT